MLFNLEALQSLAEAEPSPPTVSKKKKKRKSNKASSIQQSPAAEAEEQELAQRPSTPPAAWPPRCISGTGPPCARKPPASSLHLSNPNSPDPYLTRAMPSRPESAPPSGRAAAPGASKVAGTLVTLPDADTNQPTNWSVDAPLPSIQTVKGREQFLQTPAFVIAAHYERGETLRAKAHREDLGGKLKQAARFQKAVVKEKMDLEEALTRTTSELEWYKAENKQMKLKCLQMSEQLLVMQRSARDAKAAHSVLSQQVQAKQAAAGNSQQLQYELGQAQSEVAKLRALLAAAGIKSP